MKGPSSMMITVWDRVGFLNLRRVALAAIMVGMAIALSFRLGAQPPAAPVNEDSDNRIFICQPDGSGMKPLLDMPDYKMQGSPTWSQDGKLIAFDAWRPRLNETNTDGKVILVNADGTNPKVLADGAMPSFSPRHNRIAF